jgi:hypothetical protein
MRFEVVVLASLLDWSDRRSDADVDVETGTACPVDEDTDDTQKAAVRRAILAAHVSFMVALVLLIVISFFLIR